MRVSLALLAAAFALPPLTPAQTPAPPISEPDLILFNAVIYTGIGLAEDKPQTVQAMAIGSGKVLAVGPNDQIKRLAGPHTRLRDLNTASTGVYVFPGLNDAHTHLGGAGRTKLN